MAVEAGDTPSVRGIVKCLRCNHYQSWISYNKKTREVVGPRRESVCMKCNQRNTWRIQPDGLAHGNHAKKRRCIFIKKHSSTPRSKLVSEAQMRNQGTNGFRQLKNQSRK